MGRSISSHDPIAQELLKALGLDPSRLRKAVIIFESGQDVEVLATEFVRRDEAGAVIESIKRYRLTCTNDEECSAAG